MTNTMRTIVLPPRHSADSIAIWRAAVAAGWETARLSSWRVPDELRGSGAAVYGEPLFAHAIAADLGTSLVEPPTDWLTRLPRAFVGREVRVATLSEALALESPRFVKPADNKCFAAGVYRCGRDIPNASVLAADTPVLISEVVRWNVEYRCFARDRVCRAMSVYLRHGELAVDAAEEWLRDEARDRAAWEFAERVLADRAVDLPPAVVIDVGEIAGVGWAVIEANAAWGSGIYGCEAAAVLEVIDGACVARKE